MQGKHSTGIAHRSEHRSCQGRRQTGVRGGPGHHACASGGCVFERHKEWTRTMKLMFSLVGQTPIHEKCLFASEDSLQYPHSLEPSCSELLYSQGGPRTQAAQGQHLRIISVISELFLPGLCGRDDFIYSKPLKASSQVIFLGNPSYF